MSATVAYRVSLHGKNIDTVFSSQSSADEVKRSLINHDGYDSAIKVSKARKAGTRKPRAKKPSAANASKAVKEIVDILYPGGNPNTEWGSDELGEVSRALYKHGFGPK